MVAWPVGSEVFEDIGKRGVWHVDLQKVITQRDLEPVSVSQAQDSTR